MINWCSASHRNTRPGLAPLPYCAVHGEGSGDGKHGQNLRSLRNDHLLSAQACETIAHQNLSTLVPVEIVLHLKFISTHSLPILVSHAEIDDARKFSYHLKHHAKLTGSCPINRVTHELGRDTVFESILAFLCCGQPHG